MSDKGDRLIKEIEYLQSLNTGISAHNIGSFFGIAKNTAKNDMAKLKHAGCIFDSSDGRNGGYSLKYAPSKEQLAVGKEKEEILLSILNDLEGEKKALLEDMVEELAIHNLDKIK